MKPDGSLHAALRRLIGAEHVLAADARSPYNRDASNRRELRGVADAVALPGSAREVEGVVRWCYAHDVAMVPRGGGTGLTGGAVPTDGGVVLSLKRLRAIRELEAGLWRMLPEAGVSTRDVQRLARENGLFFGPDPGASEQSQIGGNVATNAGGPHALKYGVTGAWVTGLEAVLAPGELVQIGGWASKDVAGYDVKDLLIGSEGTLGVITAVRLRLLPARPVQIAQVVFMRTRAEGCAAMLAVTAAGIEAAAMDFADGAALAHVAGGYPGEVPSGAGFALLIEVDGTHEQARTQADEVEDLLGGDALAIDRATDAAALWRWREGFNGVLSGVRGAKVSEDVSFPVERLREGLEGFEQLAAAHELSSCAFGHGGDGNVHATVLVDPADDAELQRARELGAELFALVGELGGSIAAEHGVGWLKRGLLESQWDERTLALHEQIKRAFDPKGLMNPGKKLARVPGAGS
ncbi:MAG TPA: FAD-linked oxidase C-terminal domain-containing protein [Solirubrobacteraceae bacterium]|nr:FAD-linked oxidase C-terminal domain-containing protein [Solirubrobacteraceae bacterium]